MNAIDQYLKQVGRWILPGQRQNVLSRIREDLDEMLEDSCDEETSAARLRSFGHPPVVAARYVNYPHVIPGMLAPAYFMVLLVTFVMLLLVNLSLVIPRAIHGEAWLGNIGQVFVTSWSATPWAFTVITVVFSLLGYVVQRRMRSANE